MELGKELLLLVSAPTRDLGFGLLMVLDQGKLEVFIGKAVSEWGAAAGVLLVFVGDKLGLFKAMSGAGPLSPEDLARKTGTHPRVIKEWLSALGGRRLRQLRCENSQIPTS